MILADIHAIPLQRKEDTGSADAAQPESTVESNEAPSEQTEPSTKTEETPVSAPLEPKKKKERKRNKNNRKQTEQVGNGTPEEDSSLTEQSQKGECENEARILGRSILTTTPRKGIQYAWLYKHRHPKSLAEGDAKDDGTYWKFNKARQGWLWKNVWNEEIVRQGRVKCCGVY